MSDNMPSGRRTGCHLRERSRQPTAISAAARGAAGGNRTFPAKRLPPARPDRLSWRPSR